MTSLHLSLLFINFLTTFLGITLHIPLDFIGEASLYCWTDEVMKPSCLGYTCITTFLGTKTPHSFDFVGEVSLYGWVDKVTNAKILGYMEL